MEEGSWIEVMGLGSEVEGEGSGLVSSNSDFDEF